MVEETVRKTVTTAVETVPYPTLDWAPDASSGVPGSVMDGSLPMAALMSASAGWKQMAEALRGLWPMR
jgi:hypothetical protein